MILNGWGRIKNARAGMKAFALVKARAPYLELRLIGLDFGVGEAAEKWARRQGIASGMSFLGKLGYSAVIDELRSAHLLLHPAVEESFGMTVAEAMALGVPVVGGAKSGAVPWLLGEGQCGVLTDVTCPERIAEALESLLSDDLLYCACSQMGKQRARSMFGAERVAAQFESTYERVVARTALPA
jgi:glycosyltransferase involved in cell wall biosynthesis